MYKMKLKTLSSLCSLVSIGLLTFFFVGCGSEYDRKAKAELAKGIRNDSLFLGIYLSMPRQAFFDRCTELNKQKQITNGLASMVEYKFKEANDVVVMHFFPEFSDAKISAMKAEYTYEAWAPWNTNFQSDHLQPKLIKLLEKRYGTGFFKIDDTDKGAAFAKIDGNRRIVVSIKDEETVLVVFTDLTAKPAEEDIIDTSVVEQKEKQ